MSPKGFSGKYTWTNKAFSLVEVIIGSMALIFILLPALMTVVHSLRVVDKARDVTLGASVGQSLMEQLRMQTYAGICTKYCGVSTPTVGTTYPTTAPYSFSTGGDSSDIANEKFTSNSAKNYKAEASFKCVATGQLEVELVISWRDMNKGLQTHKLFTIISEGGLSDNVNKGW